MLLHLGLILTFAANTPLQSGIDKQITFRCPATRVENLLPLLAKKTGLNLRVGRKMADEVLIIDVKGVRVKDLMDRMASMASARWSKRDGVYTLERPAKFEETLISNEREERSLAIKNAFEKDPTLQDPARYGRINIAELLPAIIRRLDTKQLAAMPESSRLVFCSKPNAKQLPMPLTTMARNTLNKLLKEYNEDQAANPQADQHQQKSTEVFDKALLVVSRADYYDFLHFDLKLVTANGATADVDAGKVQLDIKPSSTFGVRFPIDITMSPVTQSANARLNASYSARNPISATLKRRLLTPEQYDPLATSPSDILFSIAKSERCNLVGSLPDDLESSILMSREAKGKLKDASQYAETCPGIITTKSGNWLLVKPSFPVEESAERMDRRVLGTYLRNYNPDKPMPLTTLIELIGGLEKTKSDTINGYLQTINRILGWHDLTADWYNAEPLRLLKLISREQLKSLLKTQIVHLNELNPKALAYLDQVVYRQEGNLYLNSHYNERLDASEVLPDGLPRSGTIRIKVRTGRLFVERADWDERYFDSNKLAEQCLRFWSKNPFYVGRFHIYTLQLDFTPAVEGNYTLEYVAPDRTRPYRLDNLPADYGKELQQAMERLRRSTE